jgi:hypothetical protein
MFKKKKSAGLAGVESIGDDKYCVGANPDAKVNISAARWALDFLERRAEEDPWFNGTTLIFHSGQVNYTKHQLVAEKFNTFGPRVSLNEDVARGIACTPALNPVAASGKKGVALTQTTPFIYKTPLLAAKFIEVCGENGEKCRGHKDLEKLLLQLRSKGALRPEHKRAGMKGFSASVPAGFVGCDPKKPVKKPYAVGFGTKIRELVREYAGDPNAVAVDRHIAAWVCKHYGTSSPEIKQACHGAFAAMRLEDEQKKYAVDSKKWKSLQRKIDKIEDKTSASVGAYEESKKYSMLKSVVADEAKKCGVSPALLQVGAWFKQTCRVGGKNEMVWLGAKRKLREDEDPACELEKEIVDACASDSMIHGSIGFCDADRKKKFCNAFAIRKAKIAKGEIDPDAVGKKKSRSRKGAKKGSKKGKALSGLSSSDMGKGCSVAGRKAVLSLLDRAI